jgi:hypothetical protein
MKRRSQKVLPDMEGRFVGIFSEVNSVLNLFIVCYIFCLLFAKLDGIEMEEVRILKNEAL